MLKMGTTKSWKSRKLPVSVEFPKKTPMWGKPANSFGAPHFCDLGGIFWEDENGQSWYVGQGWCCTMYHPDINDYKFTSLLNFVVFARFLALTAKVWEGKDHWKTQELTMNQSKTTLFRGRNPKGLVFLSPETNSGENCSCEKEMRIIPENLLGREEENVPENALSQKCLDPSKRASVLHWRGGFQNPFLGGVSFPRFSSPPSFFHPPMASSEYFLPVDIFVAMVLPSLFATHGVLWIFSACRHLCCDGITFWELGAKKQKKHIKNRTRKQTFSRDCLEKVQGATRIGATGLRASEREICLWEGLWEDLWKPLKNLLKPLKTS